MTPCLVGPAEAAAPFGQTKHVPQPAPLTAYQKGRSPSRASSARPSQRCPASTCHSNSVKKRGWFNVWFALAIALSLLTAPLHAQSEFAYVANHAGNNVSGYTINPATGALT